MFNRVFCFICWLSVLAGFWYPVFAGSPENNHLAKAVIFSAVLGLVSGTMILVDNRDRKMLREAIGGLERAVARMDEE